MHTELFVAIGGISRELRHAGIAASGIGKERRSSVVCRGHVRQVDVSAKTGYPMTLTFNDGKVFSECIGGSITMSVKGDAAAPGWFAWFESAPSMASAVLKREP